MVKGYGSDTYGERYAPVYDEWYGDDAAAAVTPTGHAAEVADHLAGLVGPDGTVLELGVGTGRLALPMADRGLAVTGLDASPSMLEGLRAKAGAERITLVEGDMADPTATVARPEGGFDAVLVGFNTFFNLTTAAGQASCLQGVAQLLGIDGRLFLEAFVPDPDAHDPTGAGTVTVRSIELDRVVLDVVAIDPDAQTITGQRIEMTADGNRLLPYVLRYATAEQLDAMAAEAGLVLVDRHRDWSGMPFTDGSDTHVSTWRLAP